MTDQPHPPSSSFSAQLEQHIALFRELGTQLTELEALAQRLDQQIQRGAKVLLMGNGGSPADCQHLAAEFVVRFEETREALEISGTDCVTVAAPLLLFSVSVFAPPNVAPATSNAFASV